MTPRDGVLVLVHTWSAGVPRCPGICAFARRLAVRLVGRPPIRINCLFTLLSCTETRSNVVRYRLQGYSCAQRTQPMRKTGVGMLKNTHQTQINVYLIVMQCGSILAISSAHLQFTFYEYQCHFLSPVSTVGYVSKQYVCMYFFIMPVTHCCWTSSLNSFGFWIRSRLPD